MPFIRPSPAPGIRSPQFRVSNDGCRPDANAVRMLFQGDGVEADAAYALRFLRAAAEKAMMKGATTRR